MAMRDEEKIRLLLLYSLIVFHISVSWWFFAVHFLRMKLSGIMAITNSNGDCASPWNMPLWIFTSAKVFPPAVNSTFQVSIVFLSDSKSPQVSWILLSILADLNNAIV